MTLTVRLKPDVETRLQAIAASHGLSKSQWVRRVIEEALAQETQGRTSTPFELAEELGLVGCIKDGPEDLASNAKQYIKVKLGA